MGSNLWRHNFLIRSISSFVLIPIVLLVIAMGSYYFAILLLLIAALLIRELYNIKRHSKVHYAFGSVAIIGVVMLLSLYYLYILRMTYDGARHIYTLATIIWSVDIGAYIIGSWLKGPKLAPSISPSKTWSGTIGGAVMAVFMLKVIILLFGEKYFYNLNIIVVLVLAALEQLGDLLESKFKRYHGVKDSGAIIPGHGGILDRIDGLMLTVVFYYYYI